MAISVLRRAYLYLSSRGGGGGGGQGETLMG